MGYEKIKKCVSQKNECPKKFVTQKIFGQKAFLGQNIFWIKSFFYDPPPESSRVKIVLDCCWYCWLSLPTKFHTPRIIIFGRSRVCVVGWVGGGVK